MLSSTRWLVTAVAICLAILAGAAPVAAQMTPEEAIKLMQEAEARSKSPEELLKRIDRHKESHGRLVNELKELAQEVTELGGDAAAYEVDPLPAFEPADPANPTTKEMTDYLAVVREATNAVVELSGTARRQRAELIRAASEAVGGDETPGPGDVRTTTNLEDPNPRLLKDESLWRMHVTFRPVAVGTDLDDTETNLSAAFTLSANLDESWSVSGALGTAVRTAEVLERYSDRIPATKVQLSNEFMGNPDLEPERSTQLDLWVEGSFSRFILSVNGFWRTIDDYITVEATELPKRLPLSPPTVFRYTNGEASFHGAEGSVRAYLTDELSTTLGVAWLEGEDETFDEPALGVAPFQTDLELRYEQRDGTWFAESVWTLVDEQDEVAEIRGEQPTAGYGLVDVQGGVQLTDGVLLRAGVNNLFDRDYARHLTAKNPFTGDRVLEPGAVWFVRLGYSF